MQTAPIPKNENERLVSLHNLGLLDTKPEERFDRITRTAVKIFNVPISTLTLIDAKREWYKSYQGLANHEADRAISFCGHALVSKRILVVPDAQKDDRFFDNPAVIDKPRIRFYAGVPIVSADGQRVGVFCVKDIKPRKFSKNDEEILKGLAAWAELEINQSNLAMAINEEKRLRIELDAKVEEIEQKNKSEEESRIALLNVLEDLNIEKLRLEETSSKDEAILASIGDGVVCVDRNLKVTFMNSAAETITGWNSKETLGRQWTKMIRFMAEDGVVVPEGRQPLFLAVREEKTTTGVFVYTRKDRTEFPAIITASPVKVGGKVVGAVLIFRDVTKEREIDKMKTEFVSVASHQLRTPLTGIKWFCELLLKSRLGATTKDYVRQIVVSNERMVRLVDDLLNVSHIDSGRKFDIVTKNIDVLSIIKDVIKEQKQDADKKLITLSYPVKTERELILPADELKLRQVFQNLINNAIKYSKEKAEIEIGYSHKKDDVIFYVKDEGIGIPKRQQNQVFKKFFRAENVFTMHTDGTGLGLYIVKAIVEGHGGKVWFKSTENKGTTFYFSLPTKLIKRIK